MAWKISAMGTRAAVIATIKKQKITGENKEQFEAVQELILNELDGLPKNKDFNGVNVQANGSDTTATRTLNISITPVEILFSEAQQAALDKAGEEVD